MTTSDPRLSPPQLYWMWGWSVLILLACIGAGGAAWMLDRRYCKITPGKNPVSQNAAEQNPTEKNPAEKNIDDQA